MELVELFPFADQIGYVGLALVSFIGSLIPFVPVPSFVLLATMSIGEKFNLHYLVFIAAITAAVAKQIIFLVSYGGRKMIAEKTRIRMRPFERLVKKYGATAAFIAAATPIPDDVVYVPLGLAKYNPLKFFISTLLGKIILYYAVVLLSHFFGIKYVEPFLEDVGDPTLIYVGFIIFTVTMFAAIFVLLRLDWTKVLGRIAPWTLVEDDKD